MRDIDILKLFLDKQKYEQYRPLVKLEAFAHETGEILKDLDAYYGDHKEIIIKDFQTWFHHFRHPDLPHDYRKMYDKIFEEIISLEVSPDVVQGFNKQYLDTQLIELVEQNKKPEDYQTLITKYLEASKVNFEVPWLSASLDEILDQTDRSKALKWRLPVLQEHLEGLILGDFVVVAGRPNNGKTTFLASEVTNFASQLKSDEIILWINNEGVANSIKMRLYCAMFKKRRDEILQNKEKAGKLFTEKGGDRIKLIDFHGKGRRDIISLIERYKPKLLVIDMLDHLKGFDYNTNEASDAKYDRMYQWFRELSSTKCPILGTSQLNVEAENKPYPGLTNLKGSATAKQGGATTIINIGSKNEAGYEYIRYISTTKNKVGKLPLKAEVIIDVERSRYE